MRNEANWVPTKYVTTGGRLRGSRDPRHLATGSRLAGDLMAGHFSTYLPHYARGRLLDLGCGLAPLYGSYRPYVGTVTTLDWSESLHDSPYVDIIHDLNQRLPFDDAIFDTVVLSDVLEHVREPSGLCRDIGRVLASGGHLIASVPFCYPVHEAPHDFYRYTKFGLTYLVESAGLDVVALEPSGGAVDVVVDLVGKFLAAGPRPFRHLSGWLQAAAFLFGSTRLGRSLKTRSAEWTVLSYLMVARRPQGHGAARP